jgi:hypothetical protein
MYTIIGGDGKEYGPVTADQVRSWIAGGRANLDTKVKAAGSDEWRRVADVPEITGAGGTPAAAAAALAQLPAVARPLDILSCYERSWNLLKADFWPILGVTLLITLITACIGYTAFIGILFVSPLLGGLLSGGLFYYYLKRIRGQPATLGDAFAGFTRAPLALIVCSLLRYVLVFVGCLLLIIPGIYLLIAYAFVFLVAVDKNPGIWETMELSRRTVTRQWWRVLGLVLLGIPFFLLGFIALGVGIFIAIPWGRWPTPTRTSSTRRGDGSGLLVLQEEGVEGDPAGPEDEHDHGGEHEQER